MGENVYVAIGYGLANSIMLEVIIVVGVIIIKTIISVIVLKGDDGVVIIDTLESCEVAKEVREAFEEVREGPAGIVC